MKLSSLSVVNKGNMVCACVCYTAQQMTGGVTKVSILLLTLTMTAGRLVIAID